MPRSEFDLLVSYKTTSSTRFAQKAARVRLVRAVVVVRAITALSFEVLQRWVILEGSPWF